MNDTDRYEQIASIPLVQESYYHDQSIPGILDYMRKRYIDPIKNHLDTSNLTLVDCGAGYGWLSFSYLMNGGGQAILCDISSKRLDAAREISAILGLEERCEFLCAPMQDLEFADRSVDIFVSVETLEHVGNEHIDTCLQMMASATSKLVILTTPNKLFPVVVHDTRVPFAHWLPPSLRKRYVRLFGKVDKVGNDFVSPWRLGPIRRHFQPVSTVLTFPSVSAWEASYPYVSPYGRGNRWRTRPPVWLKLLYATLALFLGQHSYVLSPNLCRIWLRKDKSLS